MKFKPPISSQWQKQFLPPSNSSFLSWLLYSLSSLLSSAGWTMMVSAREAALILASCVSAGVFLSIWKIGELDSSRNKPLLKKVFHSLYSAFKVEC